MNYHLNTRTGEIVAHDPATDEIFTLKRLLREGGASPVEVPVSKGDSPRKTRGKKLEDEITQSHRRKSRIDDSTKEDIERMLMEGLSVAAIVERLGDRYTGSPGLIYIIKARLKKQGRLND